MHCNESGVVRRVDSVGRRIRQGRCRRARALAQQFVDEGFMSKRLHQTRSIKRGDATNQLALHYRTSPLSSGVTLGRLHPINWMPDVRLDDVKRLFDHLRGSHATELVTTEGLRILIAAA